MSALRSTFNLVAAMLPIPWAHVEIKRGNQYGSKIMVEGSHCYHLRKMGRLYTITPADGGLAVWFDTRDDAIAYVLGQIWDA